MVKIGAVDMDAHGSVGGPYNVKVFPTMKVFGANKRSPQDYNGKKFAVVVVAYCLCGLKFFIFIFLLVQFISHFCLLF